MQFSKNRQGMKLKSISATKKQFSNDKAKIADVFELPITVVNNVLHHQLSQQ